MRERMTRESTRRMAINRAKGLKIGSKKLLRCESTGLAVCANLLISHESADLARDRHPCWQMALTNLET